jgi:putative membrane protein insertion efficiency factor
VTSEPKNKADAVGIIPTKLMRKLLIRCVVVYQKAISPFFAPSCRFHPTCSTYMIQALSLHGTLKGLGLGINRIAKCHPLHEGGIDNVPENVKK